MRIGIVNDQAMAAEALRRVLTLAPEHQLAWIAQDGIEAVAQCRRDTPDLVLMDLVMPRMDGVEATRRIMADTPCAILIVTADIDTRAAHVFAAMGHGAIDAVNTPLLGTGDLLAGAAPLLGKIDAIGKLIGSPIVRRPVETGIPYRSASPGWLVAIGASAGGPAALAALIERLPADFPGAIVIVQHVDARFAPGLATWLGQNSKLPVKLVQEGDRPVLGQVLIAGTDDHLVFKAGAQLGYTPQPAAQAYRPSVDVFFDSAGRSWGGKTVGVLLTGMGSDGARGLKALRDRGHHTIAQDRATSAVYGMPKAAAALSAAVEILPLDRIAPRLVELLASTRPKREIAK